MKITTWNVNSIKARLPVVTKWLQEVSPDIALLQELKTQEDGFPFMEIETLGYKALVKGQKSYNGVAILSKDPVKLISDTLYDDEQARFMEIKTGNTHIINIYAPNGNPVDTEKYPYKLTWMGHLENRVKELIAQDMPFLIGGDFNIIPEERDCYDPIAWANDALFKLDSRQIYRRLINLGLTDAYRALHSDKPHSYTFWDYQAGRWHKDEGIRIDHFLISAHIADTLKECWIDKDPRGWEKPSDHTPVLIDIDL